MRHLGDITAISGYDVPPVDVVIGGSPCQGLSAAGKRVGFSDARSGLFMEQIRLIKEMRNADIERGRTGLFIRPRFMLWENVPGAFSSNRGNDFRAVLEETIKIAEPDAPDIPLPAKGKWPLADCWYGDGWSVACGVLDAQCWGVPQCRRRIALVADFGGHAAPEILFVRQSVCGDTAAGGTAGKETAAGAGNGVDCTDEPSRNSNASGRNAPLVFDARGNGDRKTVCTLTGDHQSRVTDYTAIVVATGQVGAEIAQDIAPTLNGNHEQPIISHGVTGIVHRLMPLECERLQGLCCGSNNAKLTLKLSSYRLNC